VTIARNPGRSDASTGVPAAIASHSFWGVTWEWFSLVGWNSMMLTSAEAVHSSSSRGGTAGASRTLLA